MSTGRYGLGRRLLLLNGTDEQRLGRGHRVEGEGVLHNTIHQIARDMSAQRRAQTTSNDTAFAMGDWLSFTRARRCNSRGLRVRKASLIIALRSMQRDGHGPACRGSP